MTNDTQTNADPYIARICSEFGVNREQLLGPGRSQTVSAPRKLLMAALREQGWQLREIAALIGNRHHSTVIQGIRDMSKRLAASPALQTIYSRVTLGAESASE